MTAKPGATESRRDQRSMLRHVGSPFCGDPLGVLPREPARSMFAPLANNNLNQSDANLFLCQVAYDRKFEHLTLVGFHQQNDPHHKADQSDQWSDQPTEPS